MTFSQVPIRFTSTKSFYVHKESPKLLHNTKIVRSFLNQNISHKSCDVITIRSKDCSLAMTDEEEEVNRQHSRF